MVAQKKIILSAISPTLKNCRYKFQVSKQVEHMDSPYNISVEPEETVKCQTFHPSGAKVAVYSLEFEKEVH